MFFFKDICSFIFKFIFLTLIFFYYILFENFEKKSEIFTEGIPGNSLKEEEPSTPEPKFPEQFSKPLPEFPEPSAPKAPEDLYTYYY